MYRVILNIILALCNVSLIVFFLQSMFVDAYIQNGGLVGDIANSQFRVSQKKCDERPIASRRAIYRAEFRHKFAKCCRARFATSCRASWSHKSIPNCSRFRRRSPSRKFSKSLPVPSASTSSQAAAVAAAAANAHRAAAARAADRRHKRRCPPLRRPPLLRPRRSLSRRSARPLRRRPPLLSPTATRRRLSRRPLPATLIAGPHSRRHPPIHRRPRATSPARPAIRPTTQSASFAFSRRASRAPMRQRRCHLRDPKRSSSRTQANAQS